MSFLFRRGSSPNKSGDRRRSSSSSSSTSQRVTSSSSADVFPEADAEGSSEGGAISSSYTITTSSSSSGGPEGKTVRIGDIEEFSEGESTRFGDVEALLEGASENGSRSTSYTVTSSSSSSGEPHVKTISIGDAEGFSEGGSFHLQMGDAGGSSEGGSITTSYTISGSSSSGGRAEGEAGMRGESFRIGESGGSSAVMVNEGSRSVNIHSEKDSAGFVSGQKESPIRFASGSSEYGSMSNGGDLEHGSAAISNGVTMKSATLVDSGFSQRSRSGSEDSEKERVATNLDQNVDLKSLALGSISAEEERDLMQDLNSRFARYIDKIRRVEDPEALIKNEVIAKVQKIEEDYENQSRLARERIKDLEIEVNQLQTSEEELVKQLRDSDRKVNALEDELAHLKDTLRNKETLLKELQVKNIENVHYVKADEEKEGIVRQVETVVQHVANVATFAAPPGSMFATSDEETTSTTTDGDAAPRIGTPLHSKLMALRAETEKLCLRTHQNFTANLGPLQMWVENQMRGSLADVQKMNAELAERVKEMEIQLKLANDTASNAKGAYEIELAKLRQEIRLHLKEYNALYRTKLTLEAEIATYRKLLEEEEERLSLCFQTLGVGEDGEGKEGAGFGYSFGSRSGSVQGESRMEFSMSGSGMNGSGAGMNGSGAEHRMSGMQISGSGGGEGGSKVFVSQSGSVMSGSGSAQGAESGTRIHISGSGYGGSEGEAREHSEVVVASRISGDEIGGEREADGGSLLEMIQSGIDVLSAEADHGLDDINVVRDSESDRSHSDHTDSD